MRMDALTALIDLVQALDLCTLDEIPAMLREHGEMAVLRDALKEAEEGCAEQYVIQAAQRRLLELQAQAEQELRAAIAGGDTAWLRKAVDAVKYQVDTGAIIDETLLKEAESAWPKVAEQELRAVTIGVDMTRLRNVIDAVKDHVDATLIQEAEAVWARSAEQKLRATIDSADAAQLHSALQEARDLSGELYRCINAALVQQVEAKLGQLDNSLMLLSRRPKRSGKWFVCYRDELSQIEYEEVCDIHDEFLKHHPNGGEATAGLVAVRLTDKQVDGQCDRIRISSYRWQDVKGIGPKGDQFAVPGNYFWFLEHIRERGQILCASSCVWR